MGRDQIDGSCLNHMTSAGVSGADGSILKTASFLIHVSGTSLSLSLSAHLHSSSFVASPYGVSFLIAW